MKLWDGHELSASARSRTWSIAISALVVGLIAAAVVVGSMTANNPDEVPIAGAKRIGEAHANTTASTIVARVGQQEITLRDLAEGEATVAYNTAYMRGEIAKGAIGAEFLSSYLGIMEQSGHDNVVLGGAISKAALYQSAIDAGFSATREEVEKEIANQRELTSKMKREGHPEFVEANAFIQAVSEDYYWSEVMPAWSARKLAIGKLNAAVLGQVDPAKRNQAWIEFEKATVMSAKVEILDAAAIAPATLTGAMEYLNRVYELRLAQGS